MLSALLIGCSGKRAGKIAILPADLMLDKLDDFKRATFTRTFGRDDLWKYIDGAAEKYLGLGFEYVATADYIKDSIETTVEIYSLSSKDGPLTLYRENISPDDRIVSIGDEGFVSEGLLIFRRANILAQLNCYNPEPRDADLIRLARAIDKELDLR